MHSPRRTKYALNPHLQEKILWALNNKIPPTVLSKVLKGWYGIYISPQTLRIYRRRLKKGLTLDHY